MKRGSYKSFSQGFSTQTGTLGEQKQTIIPSTTLQLTDQYCKLKSFMKEQKQLQQHQWRANLPYKFGYLFIVFIIVVFFLNGIYQSFQLYQDNKDKQVQKIQQCLVKYEQKKCSIDKLDGQCKDLLSCMKKRDSQFGFFSMIRQILSITVSMITENILGPIMLAVVAFLLKIIQVLSQEQKKDRKYF